MRGCNKISFFAFNFNLLKQITVEPLALVQSNLTQLKQLKHVACDSQENIMTCNAEVEMFRECYFLNRNW